MAKSKKIEETPKIEEAPKTEENKRTNGFPLNGGFPEWIVRKPCSGCKKKLTFSSYQKIGFEVSGDSSGKLFVDYKCQNCSNEGTITFGDEKFTLERLCTLVILHSNIMKKAEKLAWKNRHIEP